MKIISILYLGSLANINAIDAVARDYRQKSMIKREMQETVATGSCGTLIPPSPLPPDDSTCWQWYTPPASGVVEAGTILPKGCDYAPCEAAVCDCDDYCCDTAWDLSCRGYEMKAGDELENNYFVAGCSARILCCEPESAFPKPPVGGALAPMNTGSNEVVVPLNTDNSCTPGSDGCCDTMVPPSYLPPDDSSCWKWWTPPADGIMKATSKPAFQGCNYPPCEAAVCECDSYCCGTAWDLSCRGYQLAAGDASENNYFVDGCSAMLLCCEPPTAFPKPPVGGAESGITTTTATSTSMQYNIGVNTETNIKKVKVEETITKFESGETVKYVDGGHVVKNEYGHNVYFISAGAKKGKKGGKKGSKGKKGFIPMPTVAPTTAAPASTPGSPSSGPSNFPSFITTSTFSATSSESQSGSASGSATVTVTGTSTQT